jgi:hypothetical protein
MKHILPLLAAVALLAASCTENSPPPPPELDERHVITVDGTTVRYNGQLLSWSSPAEDWQKVLGPRSRKVRSISVWDHLGVYLYDNDYTFRTEDHQVSSFVVPFRKINKSKLNLPDPDFWPQETFHGRLVVDGALIHKDSTLRQIFIEKKGPSFERGHSRSIYRYQVDGFSIRLDLGHDGSLKEFSISVPMPPAPHPAPE